MNLLRFILSKTFVINLIIALLVGAFIILMTVQVLKKYTRKDESITVLDFTGLTYEELLDMHKGNQFRFEILDSTYRSDKKPYEILGQEPESGRKVKENRRIYLTVNAKNPTPKEVPRVVDKSYRLAKMTLENRGFKIGELIYKPHPDLNAVLALQLNGEDVKEGTMLPVGTELDLVLGKGQSKDRIEVPNLIGLNLDAASFVIKSNSLNIGIVIYDESVNDTASAVIHKQIPTSGTGTGIKLGEPIDLFFTQAGFFSDTIQYNDPDDVR